MNLRMVVAWLVGVFMLSSVASLKQTDAEALESQVLVESDQHTNHQETLVLGLGCFWGAEKRFEAMDGVINVVSGYADGRGHRASYREITKSKHKYNPDNYAEVIEVTFDPQQVSAEYLIKRFFEQHDPTQGNRQGNDIGTQYRSTILYNNQQQKVLAERLRDNFQQLLSEAGYGKITTKIAKLDRFYDAEEYHQNYIKKNPNGYCPDHSTGVRFADNPKTTVATADNSAILKGQHIVVIDAEFCPYCEKFKKDVANDYQGTIPMHFRRGDQLHDLTISSETWATPTLLFMEDGTERFAIKGYIDAKTFYKALGYFKLGDSEAFNVAFHEGTDARFCRQYELFKNTPDGQFIDKISGAPLFDTKDRFNSGSGWLSFTQPIKNAVYYKEDNSLGMQRTEVRAKQSDIHLGHVFDDGPNGQPRYCINATVLEFVAR